MKKYAAFAASVAISAAALVGCGGENNFCGDAEDIVGSNEIPDANTLQNLADEAPEEISDDFQTLADAMDDPASADQAAVQEARDAITGWGENNCNA